MLKKQVKKNTTLFVMLMMFISVLSLAPVALGNGGPDIHIIKGMVYIDGEKADEGVEIKFVFEDETELITLTEVLTDEFNFNKGFVGHSDEIVEFSVFYNGEYRIPVYNDSISIIEDVHKVDLYVYSDDTNHAPEKPNNPDPENNSLDVAVNKVLRWSCSDPNGDDLTFYVYMGNDSVLDESDLKTSTSDFSYNLGSLDFDSWYYWKVRAEDSEGLNNTGRVWSFKTKEKVAPEKPNNPQPTNGAEEVNKNTVLSWNCSDDNNDIDYYEVYFGTNDTNPEYVEDSSDKNYNPEGFLEYGVTYFWKIKVFDATGLNNTSDVWSFTVSESNKPPKKPSYDSPNDETTDLALDDVSLSWTGGDQDGDTVFYDVYLGTDSNLSVSDVVSENQSSTEFEPENLEYDTTYYWKIVADDNSDTVEGDIWSFTTQGISVEITADDFTGFPDEYISFTAEITSGVEPYTISWDLNDDGSYNDAAGETVEKSWSSTGIHAVKVKVVDNESNEAFDEKTVEIMTGNKRPIIPTISGGPSDEGKTGESYEFSFISTDPDGDKIKYIINWDDGTENESSLLDSGSSYTINHSWTETGVKNITFYAVDESNSESRRNYSEIAVSSSNSNNEENNQPDKPIISGDLKDGDIGETGKDYEFSFSSTDPEGEQIKYTVEWSGDTKTSDLMDSGSSYTVTLNWEDYGSKTITVYTTDESGVESERNSISVTIGPSKGSFGENETQNNSKNKKEEESGFPWLWIIILVIIVAVVAVALLFLTRKKDINILSLGGSKTLTSSEDSWTDEDTWDETAEAEFDEDFDEESFEEDDEDTWD